MKIVFALNDKTLDSSIAIMFGKGDWFCIYDSETRNAEYIENPVKNSTNAVFCQSADMLIEKGIHAVVATRFGSKIIEYFRSQNVQMIMTEPNIQANSIISLIRK